jgi:hypothetical protein
MTLVDLGLKDFRDLILGLTINFDWWQWRLDLSGMEFGTKGLSIETWKTGWTACILSGSRRL